MWPISLCKIYCVLGKVVLVFSETWDTCHPCKFGSNSDFLELNLCRLGLDSPPLFTPVKFSGTSTCIVTFFLSLKNIVTLEKNFVQFLSPQCPLISKLFYSWRKQFYTLRVKFNCCFTNSQWNSAFLFGK